MMILLGELNLSALVIIVFKFESFVYNGLKFESIIYKGLVEYFVFRHLMHFQYTFPFLLSMVSNDSH